MDGSSRESLGRYLKRERESRGVSLEELSKGTRINLPFLEALERDDFNCIPQKEFISGFLKGYARYLGLNSEDLLRRYRLQSELLNQKESFRQLSLFSEASAPEEKNEQPPGSIEREVPREINKPSRRNVFLKIGIVIIAIGLSIYIQYLIKQSENIKNPPNDAKSLSPEMKKEVPPEKGDALLAPNRRDPKGVAEKSSVVPEKPPKEIRSEKGLAAEKNKQKNPGSNKSPEKTKTGKTVKKEKGEKSR
jgi:cytoskeletal protein RodZ